jgi:hypothetical protein
MTDYNRQTVLQKPSRFVTECPANIFEIWNLEEDLQTSTPIQAVDDGIGGYIN